MICLLSDEEISKLERLYDKYTKDFNIITGMISDLQDDRIGIYKEIIWLNRMLVRESDRESVIRIESE